MEVHPVSPSLVRRVQLTDCFSPLTIFRSIGIMQSESKSIYSLSRCSADPNVVDLQVWDGSTSELTRRRTLGLRPSPSADVRFPSLVHHSEVHGMSSFPCVDFRASLETDLVLFLFSAPEPWVLLFRRELHYQVRSLARLESSSFNRPTSSHTACLTIRRRSTVPEESPRQSGARSDPSSSRLLSRLSSPCPSLLRRAPPRCSFNHKTHLRTCYLSRPSPQH